MGHIRHTVKEKQIQTFQTSTENRFWSLDLSDEISPNGQVLMSQLNNTSTLFHTLFIQGSGVCYSFNSNNHSHNRHPWKPESDWANKAGYNYGLTTAWWVHFLHLAAQIKLRIHRGTSPHGKEGSAICSRAHTHTHTRTRFTAATDLWLQWLHNILKVDLLLSDTSGYLWGQEPVFENNIWNVNQSDECMLRFFVCLFFFHF